jgi:hypothetical protein
VSCVVVIRPIIRGNDRYNAAGVWPRAAFGREVERLLREGALEEFPSAGQAQKRANQIDREHRRG